MMESCSIGSIVDYILKICYNREVKRFFIYLVCFFIGITPAHAQSNLDTLKKLASTSNSYYPKYQRIAFGASWSDTDKNGCDTRNDILKRDLRDIKFKYKNNNCIVLSGVLNDPYSGKIIYFSKGISSSLEVQIDHVISLSDAWKSGAYKWSSSERLNFANDPLNLLAVSGIENEKKSDYNIAGYLPPNKSFICTLAEREIAVKYKYKLSVSNIERAAFLKILSECK